MEWAILNDALRRPLTAAERECVIDLVEPHATFVAEAGVAGDVTLFRAAGMGPSNLRAVADRLRQLYNGGVGE